MSDLARRTQLDHDRTALINPESVQQVKGIAERNAALTRALKGMDGYEEEYYKAFENMVMAWHIIGQELALLELHSGRPKDNGPAAGPLTLNELGITKNQSSEWQTLSLLPLTEVEDYIVARRKEHETPTKKALLDLAEVYKSADQICKEQLVKLIGHIEVLGIAADKFNTHLRRFPDSKKAISKDFYSRLATLKEIVDDLERVTL